MKRQAAVRWVNAVNAEGSFGRWAYAVAKKPGEVGKRVEEARGSWTVDPQAAGGVGYRSVWPGGRRARR